MRKAMRGHKKIPTWQEAVGILIDANMAARGQQPRSRSRRPSRSPRRPRRALERAAAMSPPVAN